MRFCAYGLSTLRLGGGGQHVDVIVLVLMPCMGDCVFVFAFAFARARGCACVCLFVSVGVI